MQNNSAAGRLASFSHLSLSPLLIFSPLLPSSPSSHPSILLCSLALRGESAVTVCPSSCGPSCLGQMGSSLPHPPASMMSMWGPPNLKPRTTGPEAYYSRWATTIWKRYVSAACRQPRRWCSSHWDRTPSCNGCLLLLSLVLKHFSFFV